MNDVRDEWEKISLAYSILSDKKQRLKYDRHSAIDNFGSAVAWGIGGLTDGISMVAKSIMDTIDEGHRMPKNIENSVAELKFQARSLEVKAQKDLVTNAKATQENEDSVDVPPPKNEEYYSPFEACSIIHEHEEDPSMNKPQAIRAMLDNEYVPVKRARLYYLFNKFKEGEVTEANEWGRVGRPQNIDI